MFLEEFDVLVALRPIQTCLGPNQVSNKAELSGSDRRVVEHR